MRASTLGVAIALLMAGCGSGGSAGVSHALDAGAGNPSLADGGQAGDADTLADGAADGPQGANGDAIVSDAPSDSTTPSADGAAPDGSPIDAAVVDVVQDSAFGATTWPACTADGWCWSNPWPVGDDIYALWVSSATDVWAVGIAGTVLHFDGTRWGRLPQERHVNLWGVWASGPADAWAVGNSGTLLHWNGQSFQELSLTIAVPPSFEAAWGSAPNDVWAVGSNGAAYHYDGSAWTSASTGSKSVLDAVWGSARDDVWAAAQDGSLLHFDGTMWAAATSPVTDGIYSLSGTGRTDVWATTQAQVLHWDGSSWSVAKSGLAGSGPPASTGQVTSVWARGPQDVWVMWLVGGKIDANLAHFDGNAWTSTALPASVGAPHLLAGSSDSDLWLAGVLGTLTHWDGSQAAAVTTSATSARILSIAPVSRQDAWYGMKAPTLLWGAAPGDLWGIIGNDSTLTHWNGSSWSPTTAIPYLGGVPTAIWGSDSAHVWIAGGAYLQNGQWQQLPYPAHSAVDVWGTGPADVWFAGDSWTYAHYNGQAWSSLSTGSTSGQGFYGVWASGPSDAWFVGEYGGIWHFDGKSLTRIPTDTKPWSSRSLQSVWGTGANDLWIVGDQGTILHYDGTDWTPSNSGTYGTLRRIIGTGPDDIWVGGDNGVVLHRGQTH